MSNGKRIIPNELSRRGNAHSGTLIVVPSTSTLIDQALGMIALEMAKLQRVSDSQGILDDKQSKTLQGYFKCLIDAQRENREQDKHGDDGANMTAMDMLKHIRTVAQSENDKKLLNALDETLSKLEPQE